MSRLALPHFKPKHNPDTILDGLSEFCGAAARLHTGKSWPHSLTTDFGNTRDTSILFEDAPNPNESTRDLPRELVEYRFSGESENDGSCEYEIGVRLSMPYKISALLRSELQAVFLSLSDDHEESILDSATEHYMTIPDFDLKDVSVLDEHFMRMAVGKIATSKDLKLHSWADHSYKISENPPDFVYLERRGYLIDGIDTETAEYTSEPEMPALEQVHGEQLDGNKLEFTPSYDIPENHYLHAVGAEDCDGLLIGRDFWDIMQENYPGMYLGNMPYYVHANNAANILHRYLYPRKK